MLSHLFFLLALSYVWNGGLYSEDKTIFNCQWNGEYAALEGSCDVCKSDWWCQCLPCHEPHHKSLVYINAVYSICKYNIRSAQVKAINDMHAGRIFYFTFNWNISRSVLWWASSEGRFWGGFQAPVLSMWCLHVVPLPACVFSDTVFSCHNPK